MHNRTLDEGCPMTRAKLIIFGVAIAVCSKIKLFLFISLAGKQMYTVNCDLLP